MPHCSAACRHRTLRVRSANSPCRTSCTWWLYARRPVLYVLYGCVFVFVFVLLVHVGRSSTSFGSITRAVVWCIASVPQPHCCVVHRSRAAASLLCSASLACRGLTHCVKGRSAKHALQIRLIGRGGARSEERSNTLRANLRPPL
jgi:hypothetical protein